MRANRAFGVVSALVLMTGCGVSEAPVGQRSILAGLLPPASELAGWTVAEEPVEHSSETLYEYLNGGADRYLAHGFRELRHVRYQLGEDPLASVSIDVYDMGGELGAFGIYSAALPPAFEIRQWGAEGYRIGTIAAAWKGSVYVHGEADDERPQLIEMLEWLMAGVGDRAAGELSPLAVLEPLPEVGRVAQSERYVPADLLGHSFLPGGVLAKYEVAGQRAELFYSQLGSQAEAGEALVALRDHYLRWGDVEGDVSSIGEGGFGFNDPTLGSGTVVTVGCWVAGIHGQLPVEAREHILGELVEALR